MTIEEMEKKRDELAVLWCRDNQFSDKDRGDSFKDGWNACTKEYENICQPTHKKWLEAVEDNVKLKHQVDELNQSIESLKACVDIQCDNGNWNYDPYMQGMANGLILALAIMKKEEPKYLEAPKKWLKDVDLGNGIEVSDE